MVPAFGPCTYKFVADQMLGRLSKWLRLMGYDTSYFRSIDDSRLIRLAREEKRTLLTRDLGLMKRRELKRGLVKAIFIESDLVNLQLSQLQKSLKLKFSSSRFCPECNVPLQAIPKSSIQGRVPSYVYQTQKKFSYCPECKRYFWAGTHWQHIKERIGELETKGY